ncbi:MAG: endonuclease domain-containing protein [Cyanobacteria bacterium J007]|nr:MAG: endonuclease domain-containing protein [Cyanobacteria bacterium J007]
MVARCNNSNFYLPYNSQLISIAKQMQQNPITAEKKLWQECLRDFPLRILRQRPIDNFIVDFYCASLKLVIEIDGDSHFTQQCQDYDEERTRILEGYGITLVRFTNVDVLQNIEGVCQELEGWIPPTPLKKGGF